MNDSQRRSSRLLALAPSRANGWSVAPDLVAEIQRLLKRGDPIDAEALLGRFPELRGDKSLVLDLAYEEYCQQLEAGARLDPDEFCDRFRSYRTSLRRLIEAHGFMEQHERLLREGAPVRWPELGETLLGFALLRELGRGAFARVFLAAEPALGGRRVALKVSVQGAAEAETLGRLSHPNIVPVYSVQQDPGTALTVVCMPYLGSATLCDVLDQAFAGTAPPSRAAVILEAARDQHGDCSPSLALQACMPTPGPSAREAAAPAAILHRGTYVDGVLHIGAQLADALTCIHAQGICHLDLKPSNVLMTPTGRPMLLDFNLSVKDQAAANKVGGTLPYMSPEQLGAMEVEGSAEAVPIDARSDLFSLGIILYELLTGKHPHGPIPLKLSSGELRRYLLQQQSHGCRPLRQANPEVDQGLARIVERCLAPKPEGRPQSAAEVTRLLRKNLSPVRRVRRRLKSRRRRLQQGLARGAYQAGRWAARYKRRIAAAAVLLVALALGGAYTLSVQDPYPVRQLKQGVAAYEQGDYSKAEQYLSWAIDADPKNAKALFYRGGARQHLGQEKKPRLASDYAQRDQREEKEREAGNYFRLAIEDYERADSLRPDAQTKAALGYCCSLAGRHNEAVRWNSQAIDDGFAKAAVYNNLGYAYLKHKDLYQQKDFDEAKLWLNKAIELDNRLQVAYYNRAMLDYLDLRKRPHFPEAGLSDIRKAIELGPVTGELYYNAACLCSMATPYDIAYQEDGREYLRKAFDYGLKPERAKGNFALAGLKIDKIDREALIKDSAPKKTALFHLPRLVDPL